MNAYDVYHRCFNNDHYQSAVQALADALSVSVDSASASDAANLITDAALGLCGDTFHRQAWLNLAIFCGQKTVSTTAIDTVYCYLLRFQSPPNTRADDFEMTAKALLNIYAAQANLRTAIAHANGVHGWRGRMAYDFLAASAALVVASSQLLMEGELSYIREKLQSSFQLLVGALHEGVRGCDNPSWFGFKTVRFPDENGR